MKLGDLFRPTPFEVSRAIETDIDARALFALMGDLGRFREWSPYAKLDPAAKYESAGTGTAVGSTLSWEGNSKVGAGRMTLTNVEPGRAVELKLEFLRPFKSTNSTRWSVENSGSKRRVIWSMKGTHDVFLARVMCLFVDMDKMVGRAFEEGLRNLVALAKKA